MMYQFLRPINILVGLLVLTVIMAALSTVIWAYPQDEHTAPRAPDFTLPLVNGSGEMTLSDQRGQVVVLNFWGSWCYPCHQEAPMLQTVHEDYPQVFFLGVAVDDEPLDAERFINSYQLTYANVLDVDDRAKDAYFVRGLPVTAILDADGYVRYTFFAKPTEQELRQKLDDILNAA